MKHTPARDFAPHPHATGWGDGGTGGGVGVGVGGARGQSGVAARREQHAERVNMTKRNLPIVPPQVLLNDSIRPAHQRSEGD